MLLLLLLEGGGSDLLHGTCNITELFRFIDELYKQQRLELDEKAMNLQRADEETRRAICITTTEFNKALVKQNRLLLLKYCR